MTILPFSCSCPALTNRKKGIPCLSAKTLINSQIHVLFPLFTY